jgi:uncharacterized protein (TIGR03435 family)
MELLRSGGVGMKINASRVVIRSWSLADIIGAAYRVRIDQISGPPWMGSQRFDIQATMPEGALPDQVPEMLQALLIERFRMVARRSQKVMSVYAITLGKNRPKLQESGAGDSSPSGCTAGAGGHRVCHRMSMEDLANLLTQLNRMYAAMPPGAMTWGIDLPTVDLTGLNGVYDFTMDYGPDSDNGGGPVMDAVEKLGLKLEPQKRLYDLVLIDQLEKVPTEN